MRTLLLIILSIICLKNSIIADPIEIIISGLVEYEWGSLEGSGYIDREMNFTFIYDTDADGFTVTPDGVRTDKTDMEVENENGGIDSYDYFYSSISGDFIVEDDEIIETDLLSFGFLRTSTNGDPEDVELLSALFCGTSDHFIAIANIPNSPDSESDISNWDLDMELAIMEYVDGGAGMLLSFGTIVSIDPPPETVPVPEADILSLMFSGILIAALPGVRRKFSISKLVQIFRHNSK